LTGDPHAEGRHTIAGTIPRQHTFSGLSVEHKETRTRPVADARTAVAAGHAPVPTDESDLHGQIMNLRCEVPSALSKAEAYQYKIGHRDARHAAAGLAIAQGADLASMRPSRHTRFELMDRLVQAGAVQKKGGGYSATDYGRNLLAGGNIAPPAGAPAPANQAENTPHSHFIWTPSREQFKDWCQRHNLPEHLSKEAFEDAASLYLTSHHVVFAPTNTSA
jgi:hypothetical protein